MDPPIPGPGRPNCRIFVDGGKANDLSTGIKIPADKWDKQLQSIKKRLGLHQAESDRLNMIWEELTAMANDMRRDGAALTAKLLHAAYIGGKAQKTGLREYLWIFFEGAKSRIAPGTLRAYRGRIRNLDDYLVANGCDFADLKTIFNARHQAKNIIKSLPLYLQNHFNSRWIDQYMPLDLIHAA